MNFNTHIAVGQTLPAVVIMLFHYLGPAQFVTSLNTQRDQYNALYAIFHHLYNSLLKHPQIHLILEQKIWTLRKEQYPFESQPDNI